MYTVSFSTGHSWICAITKSHNLVQEEVPGSDLHPGLPLGPQHLPPGMPINPQHLPPSLYSCTLPYSAMVAAQNLYPFEESIDHHPPGSPLSNSPLPASQDEVRASPSYPSSPHNSLSSPPPPQVSPRGIINTNISTESDDNHSNTNNAYASANTANSMEEMERFIRCGSCGGCAGRRLEGGAAFADMLRGDQIQTSRGLIPRSALLPTPHIVTTPSGHKHSRARTDILPTDEGSRIGIIYIPKVSIISIILIMILLYCQMCLLMC